MDIPSITAALSGIKTATDIARLIKDSTTSLEKAEINFKLADLIGALADTKMQIADVKQLLLERDETISSLRQAANIRLSLVYEQPYYWRVDGEGKDGPFCQKCYDADSKLIRLQGSASLRGWWQCHSCNSTFHDKDFRSYE
ncbi:hypothetical protein [Pseudoxanthomonas indica]|uniref:Uncharacterized protein n=1 Tax=Pseudoxanthomonas indica TaxID=428993 RepID=A0A1T5KCZ4_9GAMM|nr:hypothetical protein [Pseudoxanthomonas indica]GGD48500.1 hypothetical protein GCM10007235_20540 [Pseudoxanthomonas indica]SKC61561.1 hypothetical protein SAMN06296058_1592 [Pseudoxanthomonas indica]